MKRLNQAGISHIVLFVLVAVCLGVGLVAFRAVSSTQPAADTGGGAAAVPTSIKSKADLTAASKALDTTSEADVNPDQLDSDLNALL